MRHNFKKHKYSAKKTVVDDISFPSQLEANYYRKLKKWRDDGSLLFFIRQPKFDLPGKITYAADFLEFWESGHVIVTDCKGMMTKEFVRNKKMIEALYPFKINIVTKV